MQVLYWALSAISTGTKVFQWLLSALKNCFSIYLKLTIYRVGCVSTCLVGACCTRLVGACCTRLVGACCTCLVGARCTCLVGAH
jgi:hypothetical protein